MAAFTPEQYRFVVERLAEGRSAESIALELSAAPGGKFSAKDIGQLYRRHLSPEWQVFFDAWRSAFKADALDEELIVVILRNKGTECIDRGALNEGRACFELASKLEKGFFSAKSKAGDDAGSEGTTKFTFGLDRAEQD